MIVVLDNSLFTCPEADELVLFQILKLGGTGKFRVRCSPSYRLAADQPVNRWLARIRPGLNETSYEKIHNGLVRGENPTEYVFPNGSRELHVLLRYDGEPEWPAGRNSDVQLPLGDEAEKFIADPLAVLLENSDSDWAFLKKIVPEVWKKWFHELCDKEWIVPEHCGGVPIIRTRLETKVIPHKRRHFRYFAFFDSESSSLEHRRRCSSRRSESEMAATLCEQHQLSYHRLQRRATENYVPLASLNQWVRQAPPRHRERRGKIATAFLALPTDEHRHFFPCKGGIEQAAKEAQASGGSHIYSSSPVADLMKGFTYDTGGGLAEVWNDHSYSVTQSDLEADGSLPEIESLFINLLAAL